MGIYFLLQTQNVLQLCMSTVEVVIYQVVGAQSKMIHWYSRDTEEFMDRQIMVDSELHIHSPVYSAGRAVNLRIL